jgi:hypothetical protein
LSGGFAVTHLNDLQRLDGEQVMLPIRIPLEIESFGVNAYAPGREGRVIEEHDELGAGAGRHEELYLVARGHAVFTVEGEVVEAPSGTLVFVSDPAVRRGATTSDPDTIVLVVGGVPGRAFTPSPWESSVAATLRLQSGDREGGLQILREALETHPGNSNVLYNLACFEALAGDTDSALVHLEEAIAIHPEVREWSKSDSDFDSIRADPRFPNC